MMIEYPSVLFENKAAWSVSGVDEERNINNAGKNLRVSESAALMTKLKD